MLKHTLSRTSQRLGLSLKITPPLRWVIRTISVFHLFWDVAYFWNNASEHAKYCQCVTMV